MYQSKLKSILESTFNINVYVSYKDVSIITVTEHIKKQIIVAYTIWGGNATTQHKFDIRQDIFIAINCTAASYDK